LVSVALWLSISHNPPQVRLITARVCPRDHKVFDQDGRTVELSKLRRLADEEALKGRSSAR
jgi:hypothetical protein